MTRKEQQAAFARMDAQRAVEALAQQKEQLARLEKEGKVLHEIPNEDFASTLIISTSR